MPLKAVLLDLDDTLVVYSGVCGRAWRETCAAHAPSLGMDGEGLYEAVRKASRWFWSDEDRHRVHRIDMFAARRLVVERAFADLGLPSGPASKALADDYTRLQESLVHLYPESLGVLQALRSKGLVMALLTNGDARAQRAKIDRFGLERYFQAILIEGELGYGKPEPRFFDQALTALDANPGQACMVGDNYRWEIDGAKRLGIRAIWHNPYGEDPPDPAEGLLPPDAVITGIGQLPSAIDALGGAS